MCLRRISEQKSVQRFTGKNNTIASSILFLFLHHKNGKGVELRR